MSLFLKYLLALFVGVFIAFSISKLVGMWFPQAKMPVFIILCVIWLFCGYLHAKPTISHIMTRNRLVEFDTNTEKDLIDIESKIMLSPDFSIGGYTLNTFIRESSEIKELSDEEHLVLGKKFKNEVIYKAPQITFYKQKWVMFIGTVAGKIYKLHLNNTFLTDEEAYRCNALTCYSFEKKLGEATDKSFEDHSINHIWDTHYGNVHLGYISLAETYNVSISATSSIVKAFERL